MMERSRSSTDIIGILQKSIRALDVQISRLSNRDLSIPGWIDFSLQGSWVNFGGGEQNAAYWRNSSGLVICRGLVKSGAIPSALAIFPEGFRPSGTKRFAVPSNSAFGFIQVLSNGSMTVQVGNNLSVDLSSVMFRAEQ